MPVVLVLFPRVRDLFKFFFPFCSSKFFGRRRCALLIQQNNTDYSVN